MTESAPPGFCPTLLAVAGQSSPSPSPTPAVSASPTPARPEEQICDYNTYSRSYAFEISEGFDSLALDCQANVQTLRRLQFGPPTEWEMFTTICKGDCKAYNDRITRVLGLTSCDCSRIADPRYRCPTTPTDFLCDVMQICKPYQSYMIEYCSEAACGRFETNENDWRTTRATCSAAAAAASAAAMALVGVLGLVAGGRWQQ